jgi:hypothetical protein
VNTGSARAADQFTIDHHPDSFGAVVTDSAGNGYVTWEHLGTGGAADTAMFCKIPAGTHSCPGAVSLPAPGAAFQSLTGDELSANQVFPILGPDHVVWSVSPRYLADDTLIWTSTDGGATWGAAREIPYYPVCDTTPCLLPALSVSYPGLTDIDDIDPGVGGGGASHRSPWTPQRPPWGSSSKARDSSGRRSPCTRCSPADREGGA